METMDFGALMQKCALEEERLCFETFNRDDALRVGLKLHENARMHPQGVAIEITLNGLVVFRYFPEGTVPDNGLWLQRKRNTVELMHMSSLRYLAWLGLNGETMEDRKLDAKNYAAGGGGFPIHIRGVGVVGSICVSGLPHVEDHQLIVDTLEEMYG